MTETRPLFLIASEIAVKWPNVNYAARPYLDAMGELDSIDDMLGADRAEMIVLYFLSNARGWRGEDATRIKAELRALIR